MVCMIFIVHTISGTQLRFKMCCPDAYGESSRLEYELWPERMDDSIAACSESSRLEYELWPEHQMTRSEYSAKSSRLEYELWPERKK